MPAPRPSAGRDDAGARGARRRRRLTPSPTSAARSREAPGMIGAASCPSHCSSSEQYIARKSLVTRRLSFWSSFARPGNSPTISPLALEPMTKAQPAAPWSVPAEPFSSGRRPNSLQTSVSTRSSSSRASRSRWKASSPSQVSFRFRRQVFGLPGVGVVAAGGADRHHPDRQPGGDVGGEPGELVGEFGFGIGDRAGEAAEAAEFGPQLVGLGRRFAAPGPAPASRPAGRRGGRSCVNISFCHRRPDRRPEVVAVDRVDRRHRLLRGGDHRRERAVHREPLQRVFFVADEVEVAAHPAGAEADLELADLVVVARGEVRLVGVVVADRREGRDLALVVQGGEAGGARVPLQRRVLGERRAFAFFLGRGSAAASGTSGRRPAPAR